MFVNINLAVSYMCEQLLTFSNIHFKHLDTVRRDQALTGHLMGMSLITSLDPQ